MFDTGLNACCRFTGGRRRDRRGLRRCRRADQGQQTRAQEQLAQKIGEWNAVHVQIVKPPPGLARAQIVGCSDADDRRAGGTMRA